ncbi:MAG: sugar phosphate isomerase/epimerase [Lacunisphaera sp.]|jgi:sugar phosphate isomerase/epimerase|nr:sugar phosphate isomerase/epimerase [Lacunisphaera sp.]
MNSIQGPAIFLAQFLREHAPFSSLDTLCRWAASLGYKGVQVPAWEARLIDLQQAAESQAYCDDWRAKLIGYGVQVTELNTALAGQVMGIHPAYETAFQAFYPKGLDDRGRVVWATEQIMLTLRAAARLGTTCVPVLSGGLAWHLVYPWPQRPAGLIDEAFKELARRWKPVLDLASALGLTIGYELHPGSDLFDGCTFERFLAEVNDHPAACLNYDPSHFVLQQLDYCDFIKRYGKRITGFHVKDAEFHPDGRCGVYGGYQSWASRAGRFRSLGDGQVDFKRIFTLLTEAGYRGWAVMEWECAVKSPEQGAREGAPFITRHLIEATAVAFDDFAGGQANGAINRRILGLQELPP